MYMLTQLTKMLFLATVFPMPDSEEEEVRVRGGREQIVDFKIGRFREGGGEG